MKTTDAFYYNVDELFIVKNYLFPYVIYETDNSGIKYMKLDDYADEERIRFGMCKKIVQKIESVLDFDTKKRRYEKHIVKLTKQNLVYSEFFKAKQNLDNELLAFAKLNYCTQKYTEENYIRNDLQVLGYLTAIYVKLQDIYNKENPPLVNHMFSRNKLYKYIKEANKEELNIDIEDYYNHSLTNLIDKLYNITLNYDYEHENKTVEPALAIEHDTPGDLGHYVQDYYHVHIDEGDNTFENYKKQKDQEIYDWLVDQMHIIDDNKTF